MTRNQHTARRQVAAVGLALLTVAALHFGTWPGAAVLIPGLTAFAYFDAGWAAQVRAARVARRAAAQSGQQPGAEVAVRAATSLERVA